MKECLKEEVLQSYFDGELGLIEARLVAAHLDSCCACAELARAVERERRCSEALLQANVPVPTEHLRARIYERIAASETLAAARPRLSEAIRAWFGELRWVRSYRLAIGLASLAIVGGSILFVALRDIKRFEENARCGPQPEVKSPLSASSKRSESSVENAVLTPARTAKRAMVGRERRGAMRRIEKTSREGEVSLAERDYLRKIAELAPSINARADLAPSMKVEFEKNMLVVDQAIIAAREAIRRNPQDADARALLRSAYESKVELLSALAEQGGIPKR